MITNEIKGIAFEMDEIYRRLMNVSALITSLNVLNSEELIHLPRYALAMPAECLSELCADLDTQKELLYKAL